MGTDPVLVSYLRTMGEVGVAAREAAAGSAGSVGADGTNENRVP